jgi:acryloyl-coenzyme A reductase
MKAIVVREAGGVEAMNLESVDDPVAHDKDVVIEVEACGVCTHDILVRNGTLKAGVEMPCILGHEVSGTVVGVGKQVSGFKIGDRVATVQRYHICGACRFCRNSHEPLCKERKFLGDAGMVGGYAQYVAVEDDNVAHVPDGVDLTAASIAACTIGTILNAVRDVGRVQIGESVLVTGAGGGLGLHSLQIANALGAYVIAQTSSADKAALMKEMGAHEVIVHARSEDFSAQVKALTRGEGVDVVIDNVGTPLFEPMRRSLAIFGRWLMIGQLDGKFVPFNPAQLFLKGQSMLSVTSTTRAQLDDVLRLIERGKVRPVVDRSFALSDARQAHIEVEAARITGRAVIRPNLNHVADKSQSNVAH